MVELASTNGASPSDKGPHTFTALPSMMVAYQANGARLGWLLNPHQQPVEAWPILGDSQRFEGISVAGAGPEFPALQLELGEI